MFTLVSASCFTPTTVHSDTVQQGSRTQPQSSLIGRAEFIQRLSLHSDLERFIGSEIEWFSNKTGTILGTVALGDERRGRNYVILKRNQLGKFCVCDVVCDFYDHVAATVDFMLAMMAAGQTRRE